MDNKRIPTMPQADGERIPTMPQADGDISGRIPTMPQTNGEVSERIATIPQTNGETSERIATMPQGQIGTDGHVATMPQQNMAGNDAIGRRLIVISDTNFIGEKGSSFVIEAGNVISADSGESQIYGCHKPGEDEKYVARVLISITPESDAEKRLTRDKVIHFLDSMSAKEDSHILPLIDYGTVNINGKIYFVEIYPFCKDGDLGRRKGKITYQELHDEIIPALNESLHLFHNAGLVHRDVKPDNLYKYKGRVVIGDFGITCDLRADGFATDRNKTGTLGYYAPELMSQAAIKASDYYSFGQTIWTLYSGEMMYRNILRLYKEYGIEEQRNYVNFAMMRNEYFGLDEIGKEDAFFEILIRGLLQYDPNDRFNYDQVNRWLKGDKSICHDIAKFDSKGTFTSPFKYNGQECWDNNEVYDVLVKNWESAKDLLYSGVLEEFFVKQDVGISNEIGRIMKTYSTVRRDDGRKVTDEEIDIQNDVGLSRFFILLNQGATLVWRGTQYKNFNEIAEHMENHMNKAQRDELFNAYFTDLIASELLEYWYRYRTSADDLYNEGMAEVLSDIRELVNVSLLTAYETTRYLLTENPEKFLFCGCRTLDEFGRYITNTTDRFYTVLSVAMRDNDFYAFLFVEGYREHAWYMLQNIRTGKVCESVEIFFDFLYSQVKDPEVEDALLKCYLTKGPFSHLYWWKNNLSLYSFHSKEANALKAEIENCDMSGRDLKELRDKFAKIEQLAIKFRGMFVDNIFLAQMGIDKGKSDITSDKADAYWHYNFLDREAPIGFRSYIEKGE